MTSCKERRWSRYLDDTLRIREIADYGPQGLQIEGKAQVDKIVGTVDAHQPCVHAALERGADLLLVHHGISLGRCQATGRRLRGASCAPSSRTISTYTPAHLPLDAHPQWGNNAELARRLDLSIIDWWADVKGTPLAVLAE